jgi:hypothetical protein
VKQAAMATASQNDFNRDEILILGSCEFGFVVSPFRAKLWLTSKNQHKQNNNLNQSTKFCRKSQARHTGASWLVWK